jgi:glycosyltransferase involved in cell wall biosynthesis
MINVTRIMNRMVVGGPVHNVIYLTKFLNQPFQTKLLAGTKEPGEEEATELINQYQVAIDYISKMERSISPIKDIIAIIEIRNILHQYPTHIIHTHASKPGFLGRIAAILAGVPIIVHTFHGHVFHSYFGKWKTRLFIAIERLLARRTTRIIAVSEKQKHELAEVFKICPAEKIKVVHLGFDLEKFRTSPSAKRQTFRNEFNISDDEIVIGIIGRIIPIKNHQMFVDAIAQVQQQTTKKVRGVIVGDGGCLGDIKKQAQSLELSNNQLIFTSWRSDIDYVMAGFDIVALTSLNEGTPVTLIEAQAANKPIVSVRVGGIEDIVEEGITALLSPVNDTPAFIINLLKLIEDDKLRFQMGDYDADFIFQKFGYQRLVSDIEDIYYELLEEANIIKRHSVVYA